MNFDEKHDKKGDVGEGSTCACIDGLGCRTCGPCNEPIFSSAHFKLNTCKTDSMNMLDFELGQTLPVSCF